VRVLLITLIFLSLSIQVFAKSRGAVLFQLCAKCHGVEGYGNKDLGAPQIAGMPEWYVTKQLGAFASGGRGKHPLDDGGNRMRPMARTLRPENDYYKTNDDYKVVAEYVASLTPKTPEHTVEGKAEKGKTYYAVCSACHGPNGAGNQALNAPPLRTTNDWYLVHQLSNFKNHIRPSDTSLYPGGVVMWPMAATLPDEQAMKDVITYVQSLQ
jgi:cytochrome c553